MTNSEYHSSHTNRAGSAPPIRGREAFINSPPGQGGKPRILLPPTTPTSSHKRITGFPPSPPPRNPASTSNGTNQTKAKSSKRGTRTEDIADRCSVAMSRTESILVSSSGDVIVCRCRKASQPYFSDSKEGGLDGWSTVMMPCCDTEHPWSPVFDKLKVNQQVSGDVSEISTYEWEKAEKMDKFVVTKKGLLGGAMHKPIQSNVTPNSKSQRRQPEEERSKSPQHQDSQSSQPDDSFLGNMVVNLQDAGILPIPSFDYSHFSAGHNDMVAINSDADPKQRQFSTLLFPTIAEGDEKKCDDDFPSPQKKVEQSFQQFVHGIPIFLSSFAQIRITKVSAHPLGAHVLLISAEALLFSYGLNNHGQLGIGVKFSINDGSRGFVTTPTIVTPLLENGGKAINCAAGVDHSLVVVSTEGRRIHKVKKRHSDSLSEIGALAISRVTSSPSRLFVDKDYEDDGSCSPDSNTDESVQHHQIYGFGNNEFLKIGLIGATVVGGNGREGAPGASAVGGTPEDVLLPHRVALHCTVWPQKDGSSQNGSSLPPQGVFDVAASAEHSAALVRRATGDIEVYTWGNASLGALGHPQPQVTPKGSSSRRTPRRSAISTPNFFPIPTVLESLSYRPSRDATISRLFPKQVALGPYSSFVVMSSGICLSFGFSPEGMLGQGCGRSHTMEPQEIYFPEGDDHVVSVSAGAYHCLALTTKGRAYSWGLNSNGRLGLGRSTATSEEAEYIKLTSSLDVGDENSPVIEWDPHRIDVVNEKTSQRVVKVCAGYDSSLLVVRSGRVMACGKRSGRMGLGEVSADVRNPEPMFGGLRLFHNATVKAGQKQHEQQQNQQTQQPSNTTGGTTMGGKPRLVKQSSYVVARGTS
jgi:alpha-tubulin suppressor-like RCC1 family protein